MILQGRKIIKTPYNHIDDSNIVEVLTNSYSQFSGNVGEINYLFNYYKGIQTILNREKVYHKEINNKIVENHANEIVAFKVGYLLWKPIQYIARKDSVSLNAMELFNDFMVIENKEGKDKEVAKHQSICGTAYRLATVNKDYKGGKNEAPFNITTIHPNKAYVVYTDEFDCKPILGVFVDYIAIDKTKKLRLQAYTKDTYYEIIDSVIVKKEIHTYGSIPLVEYPLNEERMGDFEKVIGLLEAINTVQSNRLDGVEQFIPSLLVFKNVDIDDENFQKLKEMGAIKIKDNGELEADVKYLTQELNQQQVQSLKNDLYNVVLKIVGMPSQNDGNKSISANNGAVAISNGWQGADARASETEIMFKTSEKKFLKVVLNITRTLTANKVDLGIADIDIKFTRRNYEDLYVKVQTLDLMLKNEKIEPRLAFVACGLFPDAEQAYEESRIHYENFKKEQQELLEKQKAGNENVEDSNK